MILSQDRLSGVLWVAKYGILGNLIWLVCSLHEGMSATVIVCGDKLSSLSILMVCNRDTP